VRKDITSCFSQQLSLLRAREEELQSKLDWAVTRKEAALSDRQHALHQSIGSCQQALESVRKDGGCPQNAVDVLMRLSHTDVIPRDVGRVEFEKDALSLRSSLASFGAIRSVDNKKGTPLSGDSLPREIEEYEDDLAMSHKSVMRLGSAPSTPSGQMESVKRWLTKIPSGAGALDADMSALMAEFEVIKTNAAVCLDNEADDASDSASFEVMTSSDALSMARRVEPKPTPANILSKDFLELLQRPLSHWLLSVLPPSAAVTTSSSVQSTKVEPRKRRHSFDNPIEAKKYEFEDVIRGVRESSHVGWYQPSSQVATEVETSESEALDCASTASTSTTQIPRIMDTEVIPTATSTFDERRFVDDLTRLFNTANSTGAMSIHGGSNTSRSAPTPVDPTTVQSVIYWKDTIDKIQSSVNWLAANVAK
jgi:hypothetical protein